MEMDSLPTLDHNETAEPGPSSAPPSYRDAQVWKDLKAETGFASCADYLEYYEDVRPDFKNRLKQFQRLPKVHQTADAAENVELVENQSSIVIYDLSKQEVLPISLSFRCQCHSGTELIQALREPSGNVGVQIVLWSRPDLLNQEMADALVLGLKLDPRLLEDYTHMYSTLPRRVFRASEITRVGGNGINTTISQTFMPGKATAVPVLLVASSHFASYRGGLFEEILAGGDERNPPFHRPAARENEPFRARESADWKRNEQLYAKAVERFIEQDRFATPSKAFLLLAATSPLLYIEACQVQKASEQVRGTYKILTRTKTMGWITSRTGYKDLEQDLDRQRLELRRTLEEAEDYVSHIFMYLGSEAHLDWSKERSYLDIEADWRTLINEERRLETQVRDYMQIQAGNLALEESRRSIELSNSQIQESKSVKIFTILAFVYVPINLATSIFGMNIKQLNGNGQNLWVFFTTVVVALVITGGSWLSFNRFVKGEAVAWYKERATTKRLSDETEYKREYGLLLRMAMLAWLVRHGYKAWMWHSGAWIAILINSKAPGKINLGVAISRRGSEPACKYVSECSELRGIRKIYFRVISGTANVTWSPLRFLFRPSIREIPSNNIPKV